jgi:hypothetical protein
MDLLNEQFLLYFTVKHPGDEEGYFAEIFRDDFTVTGSNSEPR